ncbi:SMC family ATPase [Paenibacillus sp. LHD-117]|uniref:SMC family ATPase n=1 Tax=Paenibacillus sp. LHD-117 TaxID=3071412 RepID=UPI0027E08679|nr:SMC family ATPase [Paenibacillus sp. LHD-117]MDQ6421937.1 SMC family ATPase [Paenibacillus sp. LHD-117]
MRINSITIEAFRGFQETRTFQFPDTNVIILHGPNGYGKTSFFDAIEWVLTGAIYRYEEDSERKAYQYIGNHFANGRPPSVTIELSDANTKLKVTRTGVPYQSVRTGEGVSYIAVEVNGDSLPEEDAEDVLKGLLVHKEWLERVDVNKSLFLTHLLCQERMNGILRGMKEKDRYHAVSRIFGTEQFTVYRDVVHKAKAELEIRRDEFQRKLDSLKADKQSLEMRSQSLKAELDDASTLSRHSQWQTTLQSFQEEFPSLLSSMSAPREIKEWVQEAQSQSDRLELERSEIDNVMFRKLALAKVALTSLVDKQPQLMQWEQQYQLAAALHDMELKTERLQQLFDDTDAYLETDQRIHQKAHQADELLVQAQQLRNTADQLYIALDRVTSLIDTAQFTQNYIGINGAFAMNHPTLEDVPRIELIEALLQLEEQWHSLMECERQYREAEQTCTQQSAIVQQFVRHEERHQTFLKQVLQFAVEQPELKHCPACGTEGIHTNHLTDYARSQLDVMHPDLGAAKIREVELEQARQVSETRLLAARQNWKDRETTVLDLLLKWRQHHKALLAQEADARVKYTDLHQELQQISQSQENYKERAAVLELDVLHTDLKEQITYSLLACKQQINGLQSGLGAASASLAFKPLHVLSHDIQQLRDDKLVWIRRLTAVGIVGADSPEADFQDIEEKLNAMTIALQGQQQENSRRHAISKQLLKIFRTDHDLTLLDDLQQQLAVKETLIERVEEGLRVLNDNIDVLKDAESTVPDAINALTERVMDQMFDTMRAVFVRINSHPLFTDIDYETDKKYNNNRLFLKVMTGGNASVGQQEANPAYIFSAAQVNATAISFFLAMALTQSWSPLQFVAMDDPVQSMDDLNVTALIDLIRDLANPSQQNHKQFIISTHDSTFYELMRRKFRVLNIGVVEYDSYSEVGPTYKQHLIEAQEHKSLVIMSKNSRVIEPTVEPDEGDLYQL